MIFWAAVAGALIGLISELGMGGLIIGGFVGAVMGKWLQDLLRAELGRTIKIREDARDSGWQYRDAPAQAAVPGADQPIAAQAAAPPPKPAPPPEPIAQAWPDAAPAQPQRAAAATAAAPRIKGPAEPAHEPVKDWLDEGPFDRVRDWLLGGNTIVRVGLVMLFIGLVFLARLVVQAGLFPIEARLATIAAAGVALLGVGFAKRLTRPDFGLQMQGAGVAVLYLTVFAGARIYGVLPPTAAFGFMIVFAALGATLAVMQNSRTLALASFLGGYAVPVLLGGHAETPTGLFTYMTVLNLAIMGIAWKKSWRPLNLLGFAATFLLAGLWGFTSYTDANFLICELFLGLSIAIYLATAMLYAHNTPGKLGNFADSTLLFGTAIAGFGLQEGLVHDRPYASAWSALAFGAVYLALAVWAMRRRREGMGLMAESMAAIGLGFVTLAIPLALDAKWTSAAWALEGAGAFWVGARQARWMPRAFGLLLQVLGAGIVFVMLQPNISAMPFANDGFITPLLVALPLLFTAWQLRRPLEHSGSSWAKAWQPLEASLEQLWFFAGFGFLCTAIVQEATRLLPVAQVTEYSYPEPFLRYDQSCFVIMLGILALMAVADWLGRRSDWRVASWPARLSLPLIGFTFLETLVLGRYVTQMPDLICWVAAIALHFAMLLRADLAPASAASRWNGGMHAAGVWLLTAMLADALFYAVDQADLWDSTWAGVVFLVAGIAVLLGLTLWAGRAAPLPGPNRLGWPRNVHARAYWWRAALPVVALVYFGALFGTAWAEGNTAPLPYIPLFNPIDLAVALALVSLALWRRVVASAQPRPFGAALAGGPPALAAGALLGWVWINTVWIRTAHHYLGVGWESGTVVSNPVVMSGFSVLWTLLAMGLMLFAHRRHQRTPWLLGAGLLVIVVVKLLFIDMAQAEGFARVIAFIAVGVLMLLIGYFVPLPPRKEPAAPPKQAEAKA